MSMKRCKAEGKPGVSKSEAAKLRAEAKAAKEALQETEKRLSLLGDNLPDSSVYQYVREPDGRVRFVYFSAGIERTNGVRAEDVLKDAGTLHRQILPEYLKRLAEAEERSARDLTDFDMDVPMRRPDGQMRWMRLHSRPRRLKDGRTIWDGVQTDVTERKRMEQAARESEDRLALALRSAGMGVWQLELRDPKRRHFDEQVCRCLGIDPAHFGGSGEEFYNAVHPEDRGKLRAILERTIATGAPYEVEYRAVWPDGSTHHITARGQLVCDSQGQPLRIDGLVWDVTERKVAEAALLASEAKYRKLFENMTEEVHYWELVRDAAGEIKTWKLVDANPPTLRTWGRTSIEEIRGKTTDEIFGPGATEHYMPTVRKLMAEGVPHVFEDYFPNLDKHFRFTSVPLGDHFITTGADITGIKKAEEKLRESLREKEVMLKEIHHRVKNNLQVIASLVNLQTDVLEEPRLRRVFQDVRDRVRSMALVHEKLYQTESLARVDFADYTRSLLHYLLRSYGGPESAIQLKLDLQPVSLSVETAVPCGLILNELVSNALKHAFRGRTEGEVRVGLGMRGDGKAVLRVSDNGIGLPEGRAWKRSRSLGLHLIDLLTKQLGATVETRVEGGTEFEITFEPEQNKEGK
jgi:PAS domain S-box-containing protein